MGTMSMVDTDAIKSTITKLDSVMAGIKADVKQAQSALGTLDKGWKGEVKTEFFAVVQKDLEALAEMEQQYDEVIALMRESAEDFDRNDREIVDTSKMQRKK